MKTIFVGGFGLLNDFSADSTDVLEPTPVTARTIPVCGRAAEVVTYVIDVAVFADIQAEPPFREYS